MKLNDSQLKLLSETLSNVGLIFFASLVAPFFNGSELQEGFVFSGLFFILWILDFFIANC